MQDIARLVKEDKMQPEEEKKPLFSIKAQYIKDISFENPNSPQSLFSNAQPEMKVSIDIRAQRVQEELYETTIHVGVRAKAENLTLFIVELDYSGLFQISGVPEEKIEPLLMVDGAFILFPFVRRVISDVTRDGGFPPLMLELIDFHALYLQNRAS